jgi:hypothetical protein
MTTTADEHQTLEEFYPVADGKTGIMHELNKNGDSVHMWDAGDPDDVDAARAHFQVMTRDKKFFAYRAEGKDGHRGDKITKFDPAIERIIFVKQPVGG